MKRRIIALLIIGVAALSAGLGVFVLGGHGGSSKLLVSNVIAVPESGSAQALSVFFKLVNSGGPDALLSVTSSRGGEVEIIRPEDTGVTPIPAHSSPTFSSDGVYLSVEGMEPLPDEGTLIPLVLHFEKAGTVAVKARVSARGGMMMDHSGHMMKSMSDGPVPKMAMTVTKLHDGNGWDIGLETENFEFVKHGGMVPDEQGKGHAHLYLNGLKLGRLYKRSAQIGPLLPGTYTVQVVLNTNNHMPVMADGKPVEASAKITAN